MEFNSIIYKSYILWKKLIIKEENQYDYLE